MAEKRMFSKSIIDSDAYLDLPFASQALYFQLCMRADDDGLVDNAKKIMRITGSKEADLKKLIAAGFILPLNDGIYAVTHWNIHNTIRADRRKASNHLSTMMCLTRDVDGKYVLSDDGQVTGNCQTDDNQMTTNCQPDDGQVTGNLQPNGAPDIGIDIEKDKGIGKDIDIDNSCCGYNYSLYKGPDQLQQLSELDEKTAVSIMSLWNSLKVTQPLKSIALLGTRANNTRLCINGDIQGFLGTIAGLDDQEFFKKNLADTGKRITYDWFVKPDNYQKIIEGNYLHAYTKEEKKHGSIWDY